MKIYFAHCMADYDTLRERLALRLISARFPDYEIVNPNSPGISGDYETHRSKDDPMLYFRQIVNGCDALAFLYNAGDTRSVGAGVGAEVLEALVHGKPIFFIDISINGDRVAGALDRCSGMPEHVLSIEESRALTKLAQKAGG